jgi:2-polyprenyl-6-methoxyphenol hydroxylase-like FAD-dependent oxidoreductase
MFAALTTLPHRSISSCMYLDAFSAEPPKISADSFRRLLQQVQATFRWALYDREPLPTWTRGRLTLLGDAAHPMLPHLGQGANQSIEDGMALATILARADRKTAPAALLAYERGCALSGSRWSSVARGRTACATTLPPPTWASGMPRSPPMPRSGSGSTIMTSCRKHKPRQQTWHDRLPANLLQFEHPR